MSSRALPVSVVVGGLVTVLLAGASPVVAQGNPVGGAGNHYFLSGTGNPTGRAIVDFYYGDPGDQVYFGDFVDDEGAFGGDGRDDAMVRRGNDFIIRGQGGRVFEYGNDDDTVLVGDWDGDGTDTLAVRRGNEYFVKNDVNSGFADYSFRYGNADDVVLVGNWDGDTSAPDDEYVLTTDTLAVRRGNQYFIKNDTTSGFAEYMAVFGDPGDVVLVGDWGWPPYVGNDPDTPQQETDHVTNGGSGDYADQFAVRRGNRYFTSEELDSKAQGPRRGTGVGTWNEFAFGDATDTAFTAQLEFTYDLNGTPDTLYGDGLAVRRNG